MSTHLANRILIAVWMLCITQTHAQKAVYGLASPFAIQPDQSVFYKTDYFPFNTPIMKVTWPDGLTVIKETPEAFYVKGKLMRPFDNIRFKLLGADYDIPCRNTRMVAVSFVFETPQPAKSVAIKGTFNAWVPDTTLAKPVGKLPTRKWEVSNLQANEGYHQYKLLVNGVETNPTNATLVPNGMGGNNAQLVVGNPETKMPEVSASYANKELSLQFTHALFYLAYCNNHLISKGQVPLSGRIALKIPEKAKNEKRTHIRIFTCNQYKAGNDLFIPLEYGNVVINDTSALTRQDLHRNIMYFMMVDRFANGNPLNDPIPLDSVLPSAQFLGGDLQGIQQKINANYFTQLGVNTLWLSPISQNAKGAWGYWNKNVTTKFSAYHGYWPTSYSIIDERFGNSTQFKNVITDAHNKELNIVLDFVAHHVHTDHPLYQQHPDWATSLKLPDGTLNTERWDDHRLTTWFDTFLPTLDLQRREVREAISDSILYWVNNYDIDGFRHDASKHVPEEFWRLLTYKIKKRVVLKPTSTSFYQIGETYGSPDLIASYVNSGQMDAQFDFNLYDAAINAFALPPQNDTQHWEPLKKTVLQSFDYYGWHHLMGNISGNQDRPRFASIADGSIQPSEDAKLAGWSRTITNANELGYSRMLQLMAFNFTIPGIPVIYYGDEYAMPGGNDPDNRRMMQFDSLNESQQQLVEKIKVLTGLRQSNLALVYGEFRWLPVSTQCLAYEREYMGKKVWVLFSKQGGIFTIQKNTDNATIRSILGQPLNVNTNSCSIKLKDNDVAIIELTNK